MISAPTFKCATCGIEDWAWDDKYQKWICVTCSIQGRSIEEPDFEASNNIRNFIDTSLQEWERAKSEHTRASVNDELAAKGSKGILARAKLRRAEEALEEADTKATIAALMEETLGLSPHGDIYINLPDKIAVRFKW